MVRAREVYEKIGYKEWRNFNNLIEKAIQLISNGSERGVIMKTEKIVKIGKGAIRSILDYELDAEAVNILMRISSCKLNKPIRLRNETVVLTMLKKYCALKGIPFDFQFELGGYRYDCRVNKNVLIEFDEQQHLVKRQKEIDDKKDLVARLNGYEIIRFDISSDIVDILHEIGRIIPINHNDETINITAIRIMRYIIDNDVNINNENEPCVLCEHNGTLECENCHATENFELRRDLTNKKVKED